MPRWRRPVEVTFNHRSFLFVYVFLFGWRKSILSNRRRPNLIVVLSIFLLRFIIDVICATPKELLGLSLTWLVKQIAAEGTSGHDRLNVGTVVTHMSYWIVLLGGVLLILLVVKYRIMHLVVEDRKSGWINWLREKVFHRSRRRLLLYFSWDYVPTLHRVLALMEIFEIIASEDRVCTGSDLFHSAVHWSYQLVMFSSSWFRRLVRSLTPVVFHRV